MTQGIFKGTTKKTVRTQNPSPPALSNLAIGRVQEQELKRGRILKPFHSVHKAKQEPRTDLKLTGKNLHPSPLKNEKVFVDLFSSFNY
jgi:hypothetical protein